MKRLSGLAHGAVGGLIAGAVVALWFLVVDVSNGTALMTPMVLGSAMFGGDFTYPSLGMVAAYSVLHFAAFAVLGVAAAWFLAAVRLQPGMLVGFAFGLVALSAFHYTGLLLGGVIAKIILPPLHVLGSNALAGMVLMAYLHRAYRAQRPIGPAALLQYPLARRGLGVGAIGAATVAVWFMMLDILLQRPFYTPAALGSAVLLGAAGPAEVRVTVGVVAAYTVLHLVAFAAVGVAFVWVAGGIARAPSRWLLAFMAFVVLDGMFIGTVGSLASWVLQGSGWWAVGVGNLLAVGAMGSAVWVSEPDLRKSLRGALVETAV